MEIKKRLEKIAQLKKNIERITSSSKKNNLKVKKIREIKIEEVLTGKFFNTPFGLNFVRESYFPYDYKCGKIALSQIFQSSPRAFSYLVRDDRIKKMDINKTIFLDTETTGLAGGAGTYIFLIGLGYFREEQFCIRQYFMRDYNEERALLSAVNELLSNFEVVVSYNGKTFDYPLIQSRYIMSGIKMNLEDPCHFDLLYPTRRLWKRRLENCSLATVERDILGVNRENDVPGYLVPDIYFRYLKTKDARDMKAVFEHNLQDILSLVALAAKIGDFLEKPLSNSNYASDIFSLGKIYDGHKEYTQSALYYNEALKYDLSEKEILEVLKFHGAHENILIDSHPHIGTDKLPEIIENIRSTILNAGGEIHFNSKVTDFIIEDAQIKGVEINNDLKIKSKAVILATGHSARDIYELLHKKNIQLQAKPFAMGVRIEHPQSLIDSIQYHCKVRSEYLPAAEYNVVRQVNNRGVYSFCMCPGGFVVPAATSPNEMVVNGMSPSARNSKFANSAMVVEIRLEDLKEYEQYGVLAGLKFQQKVEHLAFINGGNKLVAPAQRMADFVNNRISGSLPETSYIPGIISSPLHFWLPENISKSLQQGFKQFGKRMRNFLTNEAVIIGVESRTSSPIRIPRDNDTFQHPQIKGLFSCGEGAGYAGGIVSSAVDGEKCAEKLTLMFSQSL